MADSVQWFSQPDYSIWISILAVFYQLRIAVSFGWLKTVISDNVLHSQLPIYTKQTVQASRN